MTSHARTARGSKLFAAVLAALVMLATGAASAAAPLASIVLPDGTTCLHAGFGATLAFDGDRLGYTCDGDSGLVGDPAWSGDQLTVDQVWLDHQANPVALLDRASHTVTVGRAVLADGTECLSAGHGATLALGGERLAHVCGAGDTGLVGDAVAYAGVFTVHVVSIVRTANGTVVRGAGRAAVAEIDARSPIASGGWRLASFGSGSDTLDADGAPTLLVSAGRVSGSSGCNRYMGQITVGANGSVAVGPLAGTLMACMGPAMDLERRFLDALQSVRFYYVAGGELRLFGPDETLVFVPAPDVVP